MSAVPLSSLVIGALLAPAALAQHLPEGFEPRIPPGYVPDKTGDEKGLWLEVEEYEKAIRQSGLLVTDPAINNYVDAIVCRVAGDYCRDFRVYVVRNPGFNASMAPNGMMQVWTGLLLRAASADEVAAVVGHEIAHYTRLHSLERMRRVRKNMSAGTFFDVGGALVTGVGLPVGQVTAALDALSFTRGQEQEADLLGVEMLARAGYDPHASYRMWQNLIAEEEAAVVKREEPGIFAKTHPDAEDRAQVLEEWVSSRYGPPDSEDVPVPRHLAFLNAHYLSLMEDQVDTNRYGRTRALLERHAAMGVEPSLVQYFYGEMYRQRGEPGDEELAAAAYRESIASGAPPPGAYRNLGYLSLKGGDTAAAQENFRRYLEAAPDADDRAMIEFYLEDETP